MKNYMLIILILLIEASDSAPPELVEALQKAPEDRTREEWALFEKQNLKLMAAGVSLATGGTREELAGRLFAFYNGADATTSGVPRRNARSTANDRRHASPTEGEQQERAARDAVGVGAI